MDEEIKQKKKKEIVEARKEFLEPTRIEEIHFRDSAFFYDVCLWGIKPIRVLLDAIDLNLIELEVQNSPHFEAIKLILNDLQIKVDNLMDNMMRWNEEKNNRKKKVA